MIKIVFIYFIIYNVDSKIKKISIIKVQRYSNLVDLHKGDAKIQKVIYSARNGSSGPVVNLNAAILSRYIVHNSHWAAVGTKSGLQSWTNLPYTTKHIADGTKYRSSGIPYFYLNRLEQTSLNLHEDNRVWQCPEKKISTVSETSYLSKIQDVVVY